MTPIERRGKWLLIVVGSLLILEKLVGVGLALSGGFANVNWLKSVIQPIGFSFAIAFLWHGDVWGRWLVGLACVIVGGTQAYSVGRVIVALKEIAPPDANDSPLRPLASVLGLAAAIALLHIVAGLIILISPSIRAFLRHQKWTRQREWIVTQFSRTDEPDEDD